MMQRAEPLIFEQSSPGRQGFSLPESDVPALDVGEVIPDHWQRSALALPEVSELDVVRHFTRLSNRNYSIEHDFYPLGSCTMKYNPKVNDAAAGLPGFQFIHPHQPESTIQGALALIHGLSQLLMGITGYANCSLQPAAGAHGELCGVLMMRAHHVKQGNPRRKMIIPDSAHGTNPATAAMCGYTAIEVPSSDQGTVDLDALASLLDEDVAGLMLTVPNTLGLFEQDIMEICRMAHEVGALVYCDGANMNALLGSVQPAALGLDVLHLNLHKTFTTPHGGGGPGAGATCVNKTLEPYLPVPLVKEEDGAFAWDYDRPDSIGRIHSFYGNFLNQVRAYTYIRTLGDEGIKRAGEYAVLNGNYLKERLRDAYALRYDRTCMHEVVFAGLKEKAEGVRTLDVAKRMIDYGFHPSTVYFPLIVPEALMIEPTETENKDTLDRFIDALLAIAEEAQTAPGKLKDAPVSAPVRRLDETTAARRPNLRWEPAESG
jgi:glycine dehydrogenase subunit 2